MSTSSSMEPLSARIPSDLYLWLAQLQVEGATTNSDKLRVLLGQLKRQHDGAFDYVTANAWARDLTGRLRNSLASVEARDGRHSDVMSGLIEHLTALIPQIMNSAPADETEAARLEDAVVRRVFGMCEALLRQATTDGASAYDPQVVKRHVAATIQLASTIQSLKGA